MGFFRSRRIAGLWWLPLMALACQGEPDPHLEVARDGFTSPDTCGQCHQRQYREWQGSMMRYGAESPVFNALEALGNAHTDGEFAADGSDPLFCQKCHSPISVALDRFVGHDEAEGRPSRDFLDPIGAHGLSCDFCHQVTGPDWQASLLGDGIANASFVLQPDSPKQGPISDPVANDFHAMEANPYLSSAEFCGSCHDVRLSPPDMITGEPFTRLENAFTEWQKSPYATTDNPYGRVVTCQDCHMSAYPYAEPGTYPEDTVAEGPYDLPRRRVATHYFTGVDRALVNFAGQDDSGLDEHGYPIGQETRRRDLLRAACELALELPHSFTSGAHNTVTVAITNVGAGHRVPTGFSQERQIWVELIVTDATGRRLHQSGHLEDRAHPETGEHEPDGRLHDEDLLNFVGTLDPVSFEADVHHGPDYNERPRANRGLVNFGNEFWRMGPSGDVDEVFVPFIANIMDNDHSIPPLETVRPRYDVVVPADAVGPIHVRARLRFRAFPPRFLRMLAVGRPDLVDEALVDRNIILEMAGAEASIPLQSPAP